MVVMPEKQCRLPEKVPDLGLYPASYDSFARLGPIYLDPPNIAFYPWGYDKR